MKKYIAFLDILGFKNLEKNNLIFNQVYDRFTDISKKINELINQVIFFEKKLTLSIEGKDSILIYSETDTVNELTKLLLVVKDLYQTFLIWSLPLRGSILKGEIFFNIDNSINLEYNIDIRKAQDLEKCQKWLGCVIDNSCIDNSEKFQELSSSFKMINFSIEDYIIKCNIPCRDENKNDFFVENGYVLKWVSNEYKYSFDNDKLLTHCFDGLGKKDDSENVNFIKKNTQAFIDFCYKNCI